MPVIRGAGVIVIVAVLLGESLAGFENLWFLLGACVIAVISFLDDLYPRPAGVRAFIHLCAVLLLLFQAGFFDFSVLLILLAIVVTVGTINAFNFMDGINGITGLYAAANLLTLYWINRYFHPITSEPLLLSVLASVVAFLFYNFRNKARCFAGDVGSVTLAYVQIYLALRLIVATGSFWWIFLFTIYGVDSVITIIYRLTRRENIFQAHRTHLYQYLVNEGRLPHRLIAATYGLAQLIINVIVIYSVQSGEWLFVPFTVLAVVIFYLLVRYYITTGLQRKSVA